MSAPVLPSQPTTEALRRIDVTWHQGAYYVSVPGWDGGTVVPASDYDILKARAEQAERAVDVLESNARVQAKLLADTGRRVEGMTAALRIARAAIWSGGAMAAPNSVSTGSADLLALANQVEREGMTLYGVFHPAATVQKMVVDALRLAAQSVDAAQAEPEHLLTYGNLLAEINKAACAAETNAWVRDVLKQAHRAIRLNAARRAPQPASNALK